MQKRLHNNDTTVIVLVAICPSHSYLRLEHHYQRVPRNGHRGTSPPSCITDRTGRCLSACLKFQLRTLNSLPPQTKGKH